MVAFEQYLMEILLSIILMFNVAAFTVLWRRITDNEDDVEEIEENFYDLHETVERVWQRIFGHVEDETMEGHLVETEDRFDTIDKKLEEISGKMDDMADRTQEEHTQVQVNFAHLIKLLSEEENVEIAEDDFQLKSEDFNIFQN